VITWVRLLWWRLVNRQYWWLRRHTTHEYPTVIYAGLPGSGKTLLMTRDVIKLMRRGFRVYSNMAIHDPVSGCRAGVVGSWVEMLSLSVDALQERADCLESGRTPPPGVVFAFDELHLICDAREWASTPKWWLNLVAQRRHFGVGIIGTTQLATQVEKRLRTLMDLQLSISRPFRRIPFLKRLPIFDVRELDPMLLETDPANSILTEKIRVWMAWYAFAGYSTGELIISDDWSSYTDDAITEEVGELTRRAKQAAERLKGDPLIFVEPPSGEASAVSAESAGVDTDSNYLMGYPLNDAVTIGTSSSPS